MLSKGAAMMGLVTLVIMARSKIVFLAFDKGLELIE